MNGLIKTRLGLTALAAALVAAGAFFFVSQASAVTGTLGVSSVTIAPGGQGIADVRANVPSPGLGAWTLDLTYDPSAVSIVNCAPAPSHSVCNPNYGANKIRLTGATGPGLIGDISLATISFHMLAATSAACGAPSPLTLVATLFSDATVGNPQPITVTPSNGTITCQAAAAPTAVAPTATALPVLVPSGTGTGGGASSDWLVAGLIGTGVLALAGYGSLRLRASAN
jgi:hypothetical protein